MQTLHLYRVLAQHLKPLGCVGCISLHFEKLQHHEHVMSVCRGADAVSG